MSERTAEMVAPPFPMTPPMTRFGTSRRKTVSEAAEAGVEVEEAPPGTRPAGRAPPPDARRLASGAPSVSGGAAVAASSAGWRRFVLVRGG